MVYPLCRGCDEPDYCINSVSCKYSGLDFVRTAQTAVSLRGDVAANDDWWLEDFNVQSEPKGREYRRKLILQIEKLARDNADLFPPDFIIDQ
jgi:hypothetical protein